MNALALLTRLEAEGVSVSLNLKIAADIKPSDEAMNLIKENRYALLEYLRDDSVPFNKGNVGKVATQEVVSNGKRVSHLAHSAKLHLPAVLLHNLMVWVARYHELRLELPPNTVILGAKPRQVVEASAAHPWGVVYDPERYLLLSWGNVPESALREKRDLETGELLIPEAVAA